MNYLTVISLSTIPVCISTVAFAKPASSLTVYVCWEKLTPIAEKRYYGNDTFTIKYKNENINIENQQTKISNITPAFVQFWTNNYC